MIQFSQSTGSFDHIAEDGTRTHLGDGWAGNHEGKNNPAMQFVSCVGPLPRGLYAIGEPFEHPHCGPFAMRLTPHPETDMRGRDGFLIHGPASPSSPHYGQESEGCAILARPSREKLYATGDKLFEVIE